MIEFYSPSPFEIPQNFPTHLRRTHRAFGMGPAAAKGLARKLNLLNPEGPLVIFGCAGALKAEHRVGDCFLVNEVKYEGTSFKMKIDRSLANLPQALLVSSDRVITTTREKDDLHRLTGADIVDCEMGFLLAELSDSLKEKVILVRGVSDDVSDEIDFIEGLQFKWRKLFNPFQFWAFIKFVRNILIYKREMSNFIERMLLSTYLQENLEGESKTNA